MLFDPQGGADKEDAIRSKGTVLYVVNLDFAGSIQGV
jgi:hypothetical protein